MIFHNKIKILITLQSCHINPNNKPPRTQDPEGSIKFLHSLSVSLTCQPPGTCDSHLSLSIIGYIMSWTKSLLYVDQAFEDLQPSGQKISMVAARDV